MPGVHAVAHVNNYRRTNQQWKRNRIENSFAKHAIGFLDPEDAASRPQFALLFDLWLAARLLVAHLKPEIRAEALWGRDKEAPWLQHHQMDGALTWHQFVWCNRHFSFAPPAVVVPERPPGWDDVDDNEDGVVADDGDDGGNVGENGEQPDESDDDAAAVTNAPAHDTFRTRRELTDMVCKACAAAYNPHQHLGLDEATRTTKHWEKTRIRFKASVHSGTLVDMLNDCRTGYCLWFEEQSWLSRSTYGEDIRTVGERLRRAAQCLVEKKKDKKGRSTAGYCISLDRGYGNVNAQQRLWFELGVYSNAMIPKNRIGLPRQFISSMSADLSDCPQKCTHKPDEDDCRKFRWTCVHKPPFELNLWQDSRTILSYGNFFSSSRAGCLSRGSHGDKESYSVWVPESIWHYNIKGRSATDSADQARKKLAIAERRTERAGQKGMAFVVFDVVMTNAAAMHRMLQPAAMSTTELENKFTKVKFCQRWIAAVLARGVSFRQRAKFAVPRAPSVLGSISQTPSIPTWPSTRSGTQSKSSPIVIQQHHVLVDLYAKAVEQAAKRKAGRPPKKKPCVTFGRGHCGKLQIRGCLQQIQAVLAPWRQ